MAWVDRQFAGSFRDMDRGIAASGAAVPSPGGAVASSTLLAASPADPGPQALAPAFIDLSTLNGTNGFTIDGIDANDRSGWAVAAAGDINGDGFGDLIVGAPGADPNGDSQAGESYVLFGKASGFPATINLAALDGTNGFRLDGVDANDQSGWALAAAGDVNGDGFDDLIIGSSLIAGGSENAYVVFGKAGGFLPSLDLGSLSGTNGFRIDGIDPIDGVGRAVASAGDVNGDGFDDLIIGAPYADPDGTDQAGETYVLFGKASGFTPTFNLSSLNGINGFRIDGIDAVDRSGSGVAPAGDVNGDGFADIIVSAQGANVNGTEDVGEIYVLFGKASGYTPSFDLDGLNGVNGFVIEGISVTDNAVIAVSTAGDVNGDGYDDVLIGLSRSDPGGRNQAGSSFVVFGKAGGFASKLGLATLDGTNGFRLDGIDALDSSGKSVAAAGDFNGDGYDDLLIGAPDASPNDEGAGEAYLYFGKAGGFSPVADLADLDGANGIRLDGILTFDATGWSVGGAVDVNGDGYDDIIIGARNGDPNGNSAAGQSYVVFGFDTNATDEPDPLGADILVTTGDGDSPSEVAVAPLAGGGFVVIWAENPATGGQESIRGRMFDAAGAPVGEPFIVGPFAYGSEETQPSVAGLANGGFVVTWSAGTFNSDLDVFARIYDAAGNPSPAFVVGDNVANDPDPSVALLADGSFVVTYTALTDPDGNNARFGTVRGRRFDADGTPIGGAFQVSPAAAYDHDTSLVTPLSDGGFLVVWEVGAAVAERGTYARRFNAAGVPIGAAVELQDLPYERDVVGLADGGFVLVFDDGRIRAQLFDASGSPVGGRVDVSAEGVSVAGPAVAALPGGGFIVSWSTAPGDFDTYARLFNASAQPVGDQFQVNGTAAAGAQARTVAILEDGTIAFSYLGTGQTDPVEVFARLFEGTAPPSDQIDGTAGNDTLNGTAGDDVINGLGGDDAIFAQQGGDDSANGGEGNDALYFGAAATSADDADGGAGTDTFIVQGNYPALALGGGVVNNEVLLVASGADTRFGDTANNRYDYAIATADANVAAGQTLTVIATGLLAGEDLVFNGSAETDGKFRIFAGQGTDNLTGGAGSDGFFFGADGNWSAGDRVDGGGGIDSLALRGNYGAELVFADTSFVTIEVLVFLTGLANPFGGPIIAGGFDYNVRLADGNVAAGQRLDIVGTSLAASEIMTVNASAETDGSVRFFGGLGQDSFVGSGGADLLYGNIGGDALNGGPGADTYAYRSVAESTDAQTDGLVFDGSDRIDLTFIDAVTGTPANEAFTFIGNAAFGNVAGQLRAVQSSATQWLVEADVNGDGTADLVIDIFTPNGTILVTADAFVL